GLVDRPRRALPAEALRPYRPGAFERVPARPRVRPTIRGRPGGPCPVVRRAHTAARGRRRGASPVENPRRQLATPVGVPPPAVSRMPERRRHQRSPAPLRVRAVRVRVLRVQSGPDSRFAVIDYRANIPGRNVVSHGTYVISSTPMCRTTMIGSTARNTAGTD